MSFSVSILTLIPIYFLHISHSDLWKAKIKSWRSLLKIAQMAAISLCIKSEVLPRILRKESKASELTLVWEILDLYPQNSSRITMVLEDLDEAFRVTYLRTDTMRQDSEPPNFNNGRRISRERRVNKSTCLLEFYFKFGIFLQFILLPPPSGWSCLD